MAAVPRSVCWAASSFRLHAQHYLIRRQREPGDVYAERLSRVFYENYIGSIVDWYAATLFRREPVLTFDGHERGRRRSSSAELVEDADRKGTQLNGFLAGGSSSRALITGASYVLVDFPQIAADGREPGGRRRAGGIAGVPGGLRGGRRHQLEPGRARQLRMGGDPDADAARRIAWKTRDWQRGNALGVLRQADVSDLREQARTGGDCGAR